MAQRYKVLGQSAPAATTLTSLYTVHANTSAVISTISVCNRGVTTSFRVAIRPAGATIANEHYIVYENVVNQYDSVFLTIGVSLAASDVLSVYSGTADLSFNAFGVENY